MKDLIRTILGAVVAIMFFTGFIGALICIALYGSDAAITWKFACLTFIAMGIVFTGAIVLMFVVIYDEILEAVINIRKNKASLRQQKEQEKMFFNDPFKLN